MANFETKSEFTELLRMLETTDPAHADIFNDIIGALLNNDIFLRSLANQLLQQLQQHILDSQTTLDAYYQQSSGYTDQKIADLINGAPSTLDTLGEIAQAMKNNENVVTALDEAIGKKASAAEFDSHVKDNSVHITATERAKWNAKMETTGDSANNTTTFASGDETNPTGWADIAQVASGEKHSSLWRKFSLAVKNLRYLRKMLGSTSISAIGDGTVTGAITALNTGLNWKSLGHLVGSGSETHNRLILPQGYKELLIYSTATSTQGMIIHVPAGVSGWVCGSYYITPNDTAFYRVGLQDDHIWLGVAYKNGGTDVTNASQVDVYYI